MNEVEKKVFIERIKGMSEEEIIIFVKNLPDDVLRDELQRRYETQNAIVKEFMGIANKLNGGR